MSSTIDNPFLVGNPVPPVRFVGRSDVLWVLQSRLKKGESTAIVGGPHIGKSSTLSYLASSAWLSQLQTQGAPHIAVAEIDCYLIASTYQPSDFWQQVFDQVSSICSGKKLREQRDRVYSSSFGSFALERFFKLIGESKRRVVILIDEFDALLDHSAFNSAEFFGALRSLSSRTKGLALVTASRLSMTEMSRRTKQMTGSDMFNTFRELQLAALTETEINQLIDSSLANTDIVFSESDRRWIAGASGGHPYVVQAIGALLYDNATHAIQPVLSKNDIEELLAYQLSAHFADVWRDLAATFGHQLLDALRNIASMQIDQVPETIERDVRRLYHLGILQDQSGSAHYGPTNQHKIAGTIFRLWINDQAMKQVSNVDSASDAEAEHLANLREVYQRRLRILQTQVARLGPAHAPAALLMELADVQTLIEGLSRP